MRVHRPALAGVAICLMAACADESTDDPTSPFGAESHPIPEVSHVRPSPITVMTRNMYVGADVDAVIGALVTPDPDDDLPVLLTAIGTLEETHFASRAAAMAREIARARPHVVGLQEVSTVDISLPPLGVEVHLDFLPGLLAELSARGLEYEVAATVRNIEARPLPGVSVLDNDAILVDRRRVTVRGTSGRRFTANLGPVAPGVTLARGWVTAAVTIGSREYTLASTHLESGGAPGLDQLRAAQAAELVQALSGVPRAVLVGDLNDVPGSPMHQVLEGAGYTDLWAALHPRLPGYTCCHAPDLSNRVHRFDERIDYVFVRDERRREDIGRIWRVGNAPEDRVAGPEHRIWPSDHAGLVARVGTLKLHRH
jgi:endonuclease/exonuclease/phosphatase family metal-dependent hydrolase